MGLAPIRQLNGAVFSWEKAKVAKNAPTTAIAPITPRALRDAPANAVGQALEVDELRTDRRVILFESLPLRLNILIDGSQRHPLIDNRDDEQGEENPGPARTAIFVQKSTPHV